MLVRPPSPPYTISFAIHSIFWTILCVILYIGIGPWPPLSFHTRYQLPFCTICALIHFHFSWCSSCTSVYLTLKFDTSLRGPIDGNFEVGVHDMSGRDAGQSALPVADCEGIVGLYFHHPSSTKMLRFLKKHQKPKPSKTPVPPENAIRQITGDPEGECRSRQIPADKADGTDLITEPDTSHEEGPRIANQDERIENQQLPAPDAPTLTPAHGGGDPSECGRL